MDYFLARYYSSAQGRFTSVDPLVFQKEMITDPQLYNRYVYVRNNPLRFLDPKGEKIELVGSDEERKKALELLRQAVGEEAGSYLYERTTVDKEGNSHYSVEIMEKGPDGKPVNLLAMNSVASTVARLIQDSISVATIAVVPAGTKVEGLMGEKGAVGPIGMIGASPGVTSATGSQARTWILDPSQDYGSLPGAVMSNNLPNKLDPAVTLAHELGHVAFAWAKMMGPSKAAAVHLENEARKLRDPSGPTRVRHEPGESKVVDMTVQIPVRGLSNWPK